MASQKEASLILPWAENHVPTLSAFYILGVENWLVDILSNQRLDSGEWFLHTQIFLMLFQKWGTPDVDIVASRFTKKLNRFVIRSRDVLAFEVNSMYPI